MEGHPGRQETGELYIAGIVEDRCVESGHAGPRGVGFFMIAGEIMRGAGEAKVNAEC